jgi:copper(I)-binding protein
LTKLTWTVVLIIALQATSLGAAFADRSSAIQVCRPWAWATWKGARTGAAYVTIVNRGSNGDRLVSVKSPVARRAQIHLHAMAANVMRHRIMELIDVLSGQTITFAPGGLHVMLIDLAAPLEIGAKFPLILKFEHAGSVAVNVVVQPFRSPGPDSGQCRSPS